MQSLLSIIKKLAAWWKHKNQPTLYYHSFVNIREYLGEKADMFPSESFLPEEFHKIMQRLEEGHPVFLTKSIEHMPNVYEEPPQRYRVVLSKHQETHKPKLIYYRTSLIEIGNILYLESLNL